MTGTSRDQTYILHMLECIGRVEQYVGEDAERFNSDPMVRDAALRNLQIMAESSQRLSDLAKATQPQIDWRAISGFRNILVHDYLGVDLGLVWQVIVKELPELKSALEKMSASE